MRFTDAARFLLVAAVAAATAAKGQASNDDPNGKKFYITAPACDSYQCHFKVKAGHKLALNWLNPLKGRINILLEPAEGQNGLKTYTIAHHIAADNHNNKCKKSGQQSCGMYDWTVPADAKPGLYSVNIHSLYNKKVHGYSDIVQVTKASSNKGATATSAQPDVTETSSSKMVHKKRTTHVI